MEAILIKTLQLILSLSILVIIHEFGHFIFARMFKIRVEKFYLFFDPWFSLFKFKPKGSDTEYGIGWLPLGGYVKISGMIDESMDKEQLALPPQDYEFRSKPAWQRLLVMTAGVIFNFILAMFIYSMVLFAWGDTYVPLNSVKSGMEFSVPAQKMGFENGDILLKADTANLERISGKMLLQIADAKQVTVIRNGAQVNIAIPDTFMVSLIGAKKGFCNYFVPNVIDSVVADSPAQKAGLQPKDSIVSVDGIPTPGILSFATETKGKKNKLVKIAFYRAGIEQTVEVKTDEDSKFGFTRVAPNLKIDTINYSFFAAIPAGMRLGVQTLQGYIDQFKYVFTKEGATSVGGFVSLGSLFPAQWDWQSFWMMTAFLSVILAFMNILPIPALDGGHVMFLFYEVITGRKPSDKFLEYTQVIGMVLLLALLLFANGNDIVRLIKEHF